MVSYINSDVEFDTLLRTEGKLVVVDFFASWCGPCKMIAPQFEALAQKYEAVCFAKVQQDGAGASICASQDIRAFPTFKLFINGTCVDEMKGADIATLEAKIIQHSASVPQSFAGAGHSLGGTGAAPNMSAREARLKRFGADGGSQSSPPKPPTAAEQPSTETDSELQKALLMSMAQSEPTSTTGATEPTPVTSEETPATTDEGAMEVDASSTEMQLPPVNDNLLQQVIEMGFPEVRARKALMSGAGTVENAVNWIIDHGEDADIDAPIALVPKTTGGAADQTSSAQMRSWRCVETGRLFRSMDELQIYAEKTGRSNFEESTEEKKPLSPEQIAAKKEELKRKLAQRRAEREQGEQIDEVQREKQRREMGQQVQMTREQMEKEKRMREFAKAKKEKEEARRERERLRAELARDKAERKAHGGKLSSVLGVEGYKPAGTSAAIAKELAESAPAAQQRNEKSSTKEPLVDRGEAVDKAINSLSKYRVGGDGGKALKILTAYTKNISEQPDEEKFRSIKLDNNAFRTKVAPLVGGIALLKAIGFVKNDASGVMELARDCVDVEFVSETRSKLSQAYERYMKGQ